MTDLFIFIGSILACLALAQLNIVLFGIVKRALQDKAILGDKEIIVLPAEDEAAEGEETAAEEAEEEPAENAANEQQEAEETDANAAEESGESTESGQIADLAAKVAALATEVSTLAAKTEGKK